MFNPNQPFVISPIGDTNSEQMKTGAYLDLLLKEQVRTNQLLAGLIELNRQVGQIQLQLMAALSRGGRWASTLAEMLEAHPDPNGFVESVRRFRDILMQALPVMIEANAQKAEESAPYLENGEHWSVLSLFNLETSQIAHTLEAIQIADSILEIWKKRNEKRKELNNGKAEPEGKDDSGGDS